MAEHHQKVEMADHQRAAEMGYPTNYQQPIFPYNPDDEVRRKNRMKAYIAIGVLIVIQTIVITILGLSVSKVKIRMGDIHVQTLTAVSEPAMFDMSFEAEFRATNKNWGPYKCEGGYIYFMYGDVLVGQRVVYKGEVGMRTTKKMRATVSVSGSGFLLGNTMLGTEIKSGTLTLTGSAKLNGKVELLGFISVRKTAEMECSMVFDVETKTVQRLTCD